ncbi:MAG TPA: ATP-binding protein, partial [Kofleriaceae bacterium]|nr:ATP-binding protein [Kofleriaceae bacterium]
QRALLPVLDPRHPLRTSGALVPIGDEPHDVSTPWTASARIVGFLQGDDALDPQIAAIGGIVEIAQGVQYSSEQHALIARMQSWLVEGAALTTILVEGAYRSGRRTAIAVAVAKSGRLAVSADFARVPPRHAERVLAALRREAMLLGAVPVLANLDELWSRLAPGDETLLALAAILDAWDGPLVVTATTAGVELRSERRTQLHARWPLPDPITRRTLWENAIGDAIGDVDLDVIAHRYDLGAGGIGAAARSAIHHASHAGRAPTLDDVVAGVQDNIAERLGELAKRVEIKQEWSELVLPPETLEDVSALVGRVRHAHFVLDRWGFRKKLARGAGVAALFSGPPGTGKTMVSGLIARELQLELYQVDLSRIVSKWVGETEKQLAKVFEAAEAGHALLLFDEADAWFAKRSAEVKSAVDRYANLEVNYLLQRVESFGGVVILTTNLDTSIDPALRRRLASHIVFMRPETTERIDLWREMLTTGAPVCRDVDLRVLAEEFQEMTGANIRNAVLTAAFLAADEGLEIGQNHLQRGARTEYRAMGHMLQKSARRS